MASQTEGGAEMAREVFSRMVDAAFQSASVTFVQDLTEISPDSVCVIDRALAKQKWAALAPKARAMLTPGKEDVDAHARGPVELNSLFESWPGTTLQPGSVVTATYSGDHHGGRTELQAEVDGAARPHLEVFRFARTIDGLLEGFFVGHELPTMGHFWHGLYGRDYKLLLETAHLLSVLCNKFTLAADDARLDVVLEQPCGLRVTDVGGAIRMSCMATHGDGSISDLSVTLEDGRLRVEPERGLAKSNVRRFY